MYPSTGMSVCCILFWGMAEQLMLAPVIDLDRPWQRPRLFEMQLSIYIVSILQSIIRHSKLVGHWSIRLAFILSYAVLNM